MTSRGFMSLLPTLAIGSGLLSLLLLAAAPAGWRSGLLPLKQDFMLLMAGGLLGILGAILAAIALATGWSGLGWLRITLLAAVLMLGLALASVPLRLRLEHAPLINDITTDSEHPPEILAALPQRQAEYAVSAAYGGPAVAAQQAVAFPDIAPAMLKLPQERGFDLALGVAKAMAGWRILASDPAAGRIEASQASFWFGFVDDIVIRVTPSDGGSRVDIRSHSRQGRGDLGVNAARVRKFLAALRRAAG